MNTLDPQQPEIAMSISAARARIRLEQVRKNIPEIVSRLQALAEDDRLTEVVRDENLPRENEIPWNGIEKQNGAFMAIAEKCDLITREVLSILSNLDAVHHQVNEIEKAVDLVDGTDFSQDQEQGREA